MKNNTRLPDCDLFTEAPCNERTLEKILEQSDITYHSPIHARHKFESDLADVQYKGRILYDYKELDKKEKRSYSTTIRIEWSPILKFSAEMSDRVHDKFVKGSRFYLISCNAFTGWILKNGGKFQKKYEK